MGVSLLNFMFMFGAQSCALVEEKSIQETGVAWSSVSFRFFVEVAVEPTCWAVSCSFSLSLLKVRRSPGVSVRLWCPLMLLTQKVCI